MKEIGFVGTGVMGSSMVLNLIKHGYELSVYNRTKSKAEACIAAGAKWCDTVAECAKDKDVVITIVGFPKDVEEVYFGENGILNAAKKGAYVIDMTTTSPMLSEKIYKAAAEKGIYALDAPVSGGDTGARNCTLAIMVGGDKAAFDECMPVFEAMGTNIRYEGKAGNGQHVKMANQIAIAGAVSGVAEAVRYAMAMGVDVDTMLDTISNGAAGSWQMSNNGPKMAKEDYAPGFYIKHFIKDMKIAIECADAKGVTLDVLKQVCDEYVQLENDGKGDLGTQAIIEYYKR